MKILVTGIAGAIGSHMAERLVDLGHDVIGVDCLTDYYDISIKKINLNDVEAKGVKVFNLDLSEDNLADVLLGVEVVYHFAAQPGISSTTPFEQYEKNNVIATYRLLEALRKVPTLKLLAFISTSSVYGVRAFGNEETAPAPTSYYGVTKLGAEQMSLAYYRELGLPVTVLRFFSVYGPRERPEKLFHKLTKSILEDKSFPLYEGSEFHKRSFTFVSDAITACELVLNSIDKCIGEIFNIGGGEVRTTGEGISIIEEILGKKAKIEVKPKRLGDQFETKADIQKIEKMLGYSPKFNLEQGLREEVEWYKNKIHDRKK